MKRILVAVSITLAGCTSSAQPAATVQATASPATITATSSSPQAVEHFRKGERLFENLRISEASAEFAQALTLDPNFALAHVYHGLATPGAAGVKEIDVALATASRLPEAERMLIEGAAASRHGNTAAALAAYARLTELVPGDWRAHFVRGQQLLNAQKYAEAALSLRRAASLNAGAGGAQNMLGYAALRQGDAPGAIAAFEQYARLMPTEPNPQDSLGEALLAAGKFTEAEAAFQKALALSPEFWVAHEGIGFSRLYAGNVKGGREALAAARSGASGVADKIRIDDDLLGVAMAQRDVAGALAIIDSIEKTGGSDLSLVAFAPVRRARVLTDAGRYREALAASTAALATADGGHLPAGIARGLRRQALVERAAAEGGLGDVAALAKSSAALDELASANPEAPLLQSSMHYGRGALAVAKGDLSAARTHFAQCSSEDEFCQWQAIVAIEKAGDEAGAALARDRLLKLYQRDPLHLVVRSRLTPVAK